MTYKEAAEESQRRWGPSGKAWFHRGAIDPYRVGYLTTGNVAFVKGISDRSWDDAFKNADEQNQ